MGPAIDDPLALGDDGRAAVISRFHSWVLAKGIEKPDGQHVVRFCAEMFVDQSFPSDLSIPTVWAVLRAAEVFTPRPRNVS